ncbi:MAG: hypothetical protein RTU30_10035 [Candidatus Thorarchaeota archaeon]
MRMRQVAKVPISSVAYSIYVRQALDASTEVYSLDYGDRLRVFDARGNTRSSRKWSSRVRCIAVGDVEGDGHDSLVGGVGKRVLVVDHRGSPLWKISLESSVIACDARDIDGDDTAEVVVALQNKRVILWNHDQEALFSRTMEGAISDVWLEDITNDSELEVVIAERKGLVRILTAAGYEIRQVQLGKSITVFGVLSFESRKLFVTGDHSKTLRIWDIDGHEVATIDLPDAPKALASGVPDDVHDISYLVVSTNDRNILFWEIQESAKASKEERLILQQIESTKDIMYRRAIKCGNCGAPTSPEASKCESCGAILEMLDEYAIEQFIVESLESITSKHKRIHLKEMDKILRRTLPQPAAYNLRSSLQAMIKRGVIDGYFEGSEFVVTEVSKIKRGKVTRSDVRKVSTSLTDLLKDIRSIDVDQMERETGVPAKILRRTLLILLGEGLIEGALTGDVFVLDDKQDTRLLVKKLEEELRAWL